jgi:hypothetical protein
MPGWSRAFSAPGEVSSARPRRNTLLVYASAMRARECVKKSGVCEKRVAFGDAHSSSLQTLDFTSSSSPMVIRLLSVPDDMNFPEFHEVIRAILGWNGDLGYIIRVHAQEFNSFRRNTRSQALHELKLCRQEKFLYICDTLHLWEWDTPACRPDLSRAGDLTHRQ